ncbi:hypothetical protein FQA47_009906 [Oryzias melastigma]|uniref:Uncharacterized protein n=1 Tax=Oryzias melastigma TaxID=30732 RepID=A0A834BYB1_ORYME|nr:hypothetical protein FQA47_009906 [Oryzias melastigma]
MQLLRVAWALTGAAICCFLILLIHSRLLQEGRDEVVPALNQSLLFNGLINSYLESLIFCANEITAVRMSMETRTPERRKQGDKRRDSIAGATDCCCHWWKCVPHLRLLNTGKLTRNVTSTEHYVVPPRYDVIIGRLESLTSQRQGQEYNQRSFSPNNVR